MSEIKVYRKRIVRYVSCVEVAGEWFDAEDLRQTIEEVDAESDIWIDNRKMAEALMKAGLLKTPGNPKWEERARGTSKLKGFLEKLREADENPITLNKRDFQLMLKLK